MEDLLAEEKFSPFVMGFSKYTTVLQVNKKRPSHSCAQASKTVVSTYKLSQEKLEKSLSYQTNLTHRDTTSAQALGLKKQQSGAQEPPQTFCSVLAKNPHLQHKLSLTVTHIPFSFEAG